MNNEFLEIIKKRRSIRNYKEKQISDEELSKILEAGRFAPSGGNNQATHFIVIQNEKVLNDLKELTIEEFSKMEIEEGMYGGLKSSILQSKKGGYDFIYNAPTLVVLANLKEYGNAMADSVAALENMMLEATSINVGSCYINQLKWLGENEAVRNYMEGLGLKENEIICASIALGYSAQDNLVPLQRTGNPVTFIK